MVTPNRKGQTHVFHSNCRQHAADLKNELENIRDEAGRCNSQLTEETIRASENAEAHKQAEQDNNDLRRKLSAAQAREEGLLEQVEYLRRMLESAQERTPQEPQETQEEAARRNRLQGRRSQAAQACLARAWEAPGSERSAHCAAVAQAVLALPLEAFAVTIERGEDANRDRGWRVNGTILNGVPPNEPGHIPPHSTEEEYLARRYGVTCKEVGEIDWALDTEARKNSSKDVPDPRGSMVELSFP